jgi:uncharacterized protein YhaN
MWIKGIKIDGFGIFKDFEIDNLSPGLNIIYGYNENGKTTLKNFISSVIFGFKDRKNIVKRYEPVNGGTHGGKIVFEYKNEEYHASRYPGKKSEGALKIIGSGQKNITFPEILAGINREVYENVFSFGLDELASLNSLINKEEIVEQIYTASFGVKTDLIKDVRKGLEEQQKKIIKSLEEKEKVLKNIQNSISKAREREEKYGELKKKLEELQIKREEIEREKLETEKELIKFQKLYDKYSTYQELLEIEGQIKELSFNGEYSESDYKTLQDLIVELDALRKEREEKEQKEIEINIKLNNITLDNSLLNKKELLVRLREWAIRIKEIDKSYQDNKKEWENREGEIVKIKKTLEGKLKKEVEEISIPIGFRNKLEELGEKINQKDNEENEKRWKISQLQENFRFIKGEDLRESLSLLYQLKERENKKGINLPKGLLLLNTVIFLLLIWQGNYPLLTSIFALTIVPLNIWLIYRLKKDKDIKDKLKKDLKGKGIINFNNIDLEIEKLQTLVNCYQELQSTLKEYNSIIKDTDDLEREKERLFSQVGFKEDLTIKEGLNLIEEISKIHRLINEADQYKLKVNEQEGEINNFIQRCKEDVDGNLTSLEDALITVKQKLDLLKSEEEKKGKYQELDFQLQNVKKERESILRKEQEKKVKYKELLDKGQVKTPQEYEENYNKYTKRIELLGRKNIAQVRLEGINLGDIEDVLQIYSQVSEGYLANKVKELEVTLKDIGEKGEKISEEKGKVEKEIQDLEKDSLLQDLTFEEEKVKNQIGENVKKWAIYKSSLLFLDKAKKEYEEKTQPDVLKRAAEYFSIITAGRYNNIKVVDNELKNMSVVQPMGNEISVESLSMGTQEQLYICIRLGLIKEFAEKKVPLPLLFDDIFVNFDEQRIAHGFKVLRELAKDQQILFFTCHQRVLDLLQKENVKTINLAFSS